MPATLTGKENSNEVDAKNIGFSLAFICVHWRTYFFVTSENQYEPCIVDCQNRA